MELKPKIHSSAVVHPEAVIDPSCEVGPFCVVGKGVRLGARNVLRSHVVMENHTIVGDDNVFYPFSVIGVAPQDLKYRGENTRLVIGSRNTIRESVSLHIGTEGGGGVTEIGNDNLIMGYVHLGHDAKVGSHTVIANCVQIAGHCLVEDWAIVGGLVGISQFVRVGAHSYVGGCSGIDRDVPPFTFGRGGGADYQILGLNLIGLKRRGFSDRAMSALLELNRVFFKDKSLEKNAALQKLEEQFPDVTEIRQFVDFVRKAEKGVYR